MKIQRSLRLSNNISGLMNELVNCQQIKLKDLLDSGVLDKLSQEVEKNFKELAPFLSYMTQASYSSVLRESFESTIDKTKLHDLIVEIPTLESKIEKLYPPPAKNFTVQFSLEKNTWEALEDLCYTLKEDNCRNLRLSFVIKLLIINYALILNKI